MKSIVWKIFIPVLFAMAGLIFISLLLLANLESRSKQDVQQFIPQLYEEAKDNLLTQGEVGLKKWLQENKTVHGIRLYIVDRQEKDILSRALPPTHELIRGMKRELRNGLNNRADLRNNRRRWERTERKTGRYPVLRNGQQSYRFLLARPAGGIIGVLKSQKTLLPILFSMFLLSALVSALIARKISQPIQKLRHGVQRISSGDLHARISSELSHRDDEIGALANDFDVMTEKLSMLLATQQNLLRDISHELRSPLARLQVALGLAEKRSSDQISPELQRIEKEANTLNAMIGKILSLVRLNNLSIDGSCLQYEDVGLVSLLNPLIENANYEGQEKSLDFEFIADDSVVIKALPNLLSSAIENILRNAIKHGPEHSKVICKLEQINGKAKISISDSGQGVPEADINNIFEPFYRVSKTREHQYGTGGIGLAIAKQAIELHGGRIWAENSKPGLQVNIEI